MFYLILISFLAAVSPVYGSCGRAAKQKISTCISKLDFGLLTANSPYIPTSERDIGRMTQACGNGDLLTVINCLERVIDQCKNDQSSDAKFLRKMIDIEEARKSILYFCSNVQVYTDNLECIASNHKDTEMCLKESKIKYQSKAGTTNSTEALMNSQCLFHQATVECIVTVIQVKCSLEAADVVRTVMTGFGPSSCGTVGGRGNKVATVDDSSNSAYQFNVHIFLAVISTVSVLLFEWIVCTL